MNHLTVAAAEGEILSPSTRLRAVARLHPFTSEREEREFPVGYSLAEIVEELGVRSGRSAIVAIDGEAVARELWPRVRPKAGRLVTVCAVPHGGGGEGKNPLRTILMLAVVAVAAWVSAGGLAAAGWAAAEGTFAAGGLGATIAGTVVGMVGTLLVNAIIPPPKPSFRSLGQGDKSNTYAITGSSNQANPWGVVPYVAGRHRVYPLHAAMPYSELVGADQYFRCLFLVGYGPLQVEDIRIGETPLDQFEDYEIEIRQGFADDAPVTLYTGDVFEEGFSLLIENAAGGIVRRSLLDVTELSVDIGFAALYRAGNGGLEPQTVEVAVDYAPAGTEAWVEAKRWTITEAKGSTVRNGHRWSVPAGQYDVRVRRISPDTADDKIQDKLYWTVLRSIRPNEPVKLPGLCLVALRIRATDQFNGVIDQLNCIATSVLPDFDGTAWVTRPTSSPAAIYRACLQGPAIARPLADQRLDLETIEEWAVECRERGWECNLVWDTPGLLLERLAQVCAVGRAAFGMRDSRYSVVRDLPQDTHVQTFTPRNSWGFRSTKVFPDLPHALRVRFVNRDAGYVRDELTVYADGHDETTATRFESLDLIGVTIPAQAWSAGRLYLGQAILRPEVYELYTDAEHLLCTRGDLVHVAHDVMLVGLGQGRVKELRFDPEGEKIVGVVLDTIVAMEPGKQYGLRIRLAEGGGYYAAINTAPGETDFLAFDLPVQVEFGPQVGDLCAFGERGRETVPLIVRSIEPSGDLAARLTFVDQAPALYDVDSGIPDFDPGMTVPAGRRSPLILGAVSDETVLLRQPDGSLHARIVVTLGAVSGAASDVTGIEAQYRRSDGGAWSPLPALSGVSPEITVMPVEAGRYYDVRVRYAHAARPPSPWVELKKHRVLGGSAPPPDVRGLDISVVGDTAFLTWPAVSAIDLSHYVVRYSPALSGAGWGSAVVLREREMQPSSSVPARNGTYLVKAVDMFGNESLSAVGAVVDLAEVAGNVVEVLFEHPAFGGAKTGVAISGTGTLQLDTVVDMADWGKLSSVARLSGGALETSGVYEFVEPVDLGAVYTATLRGRVVVSGANLANTMGQWLNLTDIADMSGAEPSQWSCDLDVSTTRDDPATGPWSAWRPLTTGAVTARALRFRLRLARAVPSVTPSVSELEVMVDMPDRIDAESDIACPAAGLHIAFDPPFKGLSGLGITDQGLASGDYRQITGKGPEGFTIRYFDAAGTPVARTFDYIAKGYGRQV